MIKEANAQFRHIIFITIMAIAGIIVTAYVATVDYLQPGLSWMFLLPLTLTCCLIIFADIFKYHKGGYGLKILYVVMVIRYYLHPVLTAMERRVTMSTGATPENQEFFISIIMMCLELLVTCITIKLYYTRTEEKIIEDLERNPIEADNSLHFGGLAVVLGLLGLIVIRGNAHEILPAMRFFLATEGLEDVPFDSYSIIALQTIKSFLTVMVIGWASKNYHQSDKKIYFFIALIISVINCSIYFGNNRSSILQTDIATIAVLLMAFKEERKKIYTVMVPIAAIIMISFIVLKQYGVDITDSNASTAIKAETETSLSDTIDAYVCGVKTMTNAQMRYKINGHEFGFGNFMRDFTDNFFLFKIPGLTFVNDLFSGYKTSAQFYAGSGTAMFPLYGQALYYGSHGLGWLIDLLAYYVVMRALVKFDIMQRVQKEYSKVFIYTWLASLFGLTMCYCLITLLWSFSGTPFFLIIIFYINKNFKLK